MTARQQFANASFLLWCTALLATLLLIVGVGSALSGELAQSDGPGGATLGRYLGLVDYKISAKWLDSANRKETDPAKIADLAVVIRFQVLRDGTVRGIEVDTSSGDISFDQLALKALKESLPLPPFPADLPEPSLNLQYRFVVEGG
jgi:TonB family protein